MGGSCCGRIVDIQCVHQVAGTTRGIFAKSRQPAHLRPHSSSPERLLEASSSDDEDVADNQRNSPHNHHSMECPSPPCVAPDSLVTSMSGSLNSRFSNSLEGQPDRRSPLSPSFPTHTSPLADNHVFFEDAPSADNELEMSSISSDVDGKSALTASMTMNAGYCAPPPRSPYYSKVTPSPVPWLSHSDEQLSDGFAENQSTPTRPLVDLNVRTLSMTDLAALLHFTGGGPGASCGRPGPALPSPTRNASFVWVRTRSGQMHRRQHIRWFTSNSSGSGGLSFARSRSQQAVTFINSDVDEDDFDECAIVQQ